MKKLLLILVLIPLLAFAQKEYVVKEYCMVYVDKNHAKIYTEKEETYITDSIGDKVKFKNQAAILNYMSKKGWELHSVTHYDNGIIDCMILYRIVRKEGE